MKSHNSAHGRGWIFVSLLISSFLLAGCGSPQSPDGAIKSYLEAVVAKDGNKAASLSCKEWESGAHSEVDALAAVSPTLNDLSCKQSGTSGSDSLVSCTGTIL